MADSCDHADEVRRQRWRERKQSQRVREALGEMQITLILGERMIDWLIETGRVTDAGSRDRNRLAVSIHRVLLEQMSRRDTDAV